MNLKLKLTKICLLMQIICIYCQRAQALPQQSIEDDKGQNEHIEVLDKEGKYILEWVVDWQEKLVKFNVTVQTNGFIEFGLSPRGRKRGADIVVGGVSKEGKPYFTDRHLHNNDEAWMDASQDWKFHSAWEDSSRTSLSFSRAFKTCDDRDHPIDEQSVIVLIWGYGATDDHSGRDYKDRGEYSVYLLDRDFTPKPIKESTFRPGPPASYEELNLKLWTATISASVPASHTFYQCSLHQGPRLGSKHHIVGISARLDREVDVKHTHHLGVYRCTPPAETTANEYFSKYLNISESCYFPDKPVGQIPTQYCTEVKYAWGIGGRITFLPDHVGIPIGETALDEYYLIQVHLDNQEVLSDIDIVVNIDFFYTDNLREHDMGLITVGHDIPGSPSLLIPPASKAHTIVGHCGSECTQLMLPPEGVKVALVFEHTHQKGRQFMIHHFRGDKELPWIVKDDTYDANYQAFRVLKNEVTILPGDQLTLECVYDNTDINGTVIGGFSTQQEMCLAYLFYYNQIDYLKCRSEIKSEEYLNHYLGINNITWEHQQLEFVATTPDKLKGLTMTKISDDYTDWSIDLRKELQKDHKYAPHLNVCAGSPLSSRGKAGANMAAFPKNVSKYVPPPPDNDCSGTSSWNSNEKHGG